MLSGTKPTDVDKLSEACKLFELYRPGGADATVDIVEYFNGNLPVADDMICYFPISETRLVSWIEALESGKYRQTKKALHNTDGFCCLGVECEISGVYKERVSESGHGYYGGQLSLHPTLQVAKLNLFGGEIRLSLVQLNDLFNFSFYDIAQMLKHFVVGDKV